MDSRRERDLIMVKLSDGEDLFPSLEAAAREHGLDSGAVLWGIGMVRDFEIGFFGRRGYEKTFVSEPHELLGLHGSVAMRADPTIHLHATVGRPDHAAVGGHLFRAKAAVVNEIQLVRFNEIRFDRDLNPATGLRELVFR